MQWAQEKQNESKKKKERKKKDKDKEQKTTTKTKKNPKKHITKNKKHTKLKRYVTPPIKSKLNQSVKNNHFLFRIRHLSWYSCTQCTLARS